MWVMNVTFIKDDWGMLAWQGHAEGRVIANGKTARGANHDRSQDLQCDQITIVIVPPTFRGIPGGSSPLISLISLISTRILAKFRAQRRMGEGVYASYDSYVSSNSSNSFCQGGVGQPKRIFDNNGQLRTEGPERRKIPCS